MQATLGKENTRGLADFGRIDDAYPDGAMRRPRTWCQLSQYRAGNLQAGDRRRYHPVKKANVMRFYPAEAAYRFNRRLLWSTIRRRIVRDDTVPALPGAAIALSKQFLDKVEVNQDSLCPRDVQSPLKQQ